MIVILSGASRALRDLRSRRTCVCPSTHNAGCPTLAVRRGGFLRLGWETTNLNPEPSSTPRISKITHRRTQRNCSRSLPRALAPAHPSAARPSIIRRPPYTDSPSSAHDSQTAGPDSGWCGQIAPSLCRAPPHPAPPCSPPSRSPGPPCRPPAPPPRNYVRGRADCCTCHTPPGSPRPRAHRYAAGGWRSTYSGAQSMPSHLTPVIHPTDEDLSVGTPVLGKNLRRFIHANPAQPRPARIPVSSRRHRRLQPLPRRNRNVLRGRNQLGKLRRFQVQVAMIPGGQHLSLHRVLQPLQIHNKAGHRVGLARHRHLQRVIVPVPGATRAAPEHLLVLGRRPGLVPIVVRSGKRGPPRQINHFDPSLEKMPQTPPWLHVHLHSISFDDEVVEHIGPAENSVQQCPPERVPLCPRNHQSKCAPEADT